MRAATATTRRTRAARRCGASRPASPAPTATWARCATCRAKSIYRRLYWDAVRADELPAVVRFDVFDGAVNSGAVQSIKWLQRAAGTVDDGILGPKTMAAAVAAGPALAARYNGHRLAFLTDRPTWGSFGKGWARRIAANLREAST